MATKLTKKQQTQLTEKLTGIIQKNNALQLRLSADRTVNELNVNQISGELNRIHYRAIGKDLPATISFAPKQAGSGDPSPTNIRPISGYEITGIGTVYGGDLNIETGLLTIKYGMYTITGDETWRDWTGAYFAYVLTNAQATSTSDGVCDMMVVKSRTDVKASQSGIAAYGSTIYIGATEYAALTDYIGAKIAYQLADSYQTTAQLTQQQMLQLIDQL